MSDNPVDIECEIFELESEIVTAAISVAAQHGFSSLDHFIIPSNRLSTLPPEKKLQCLRNHLARLHLQAAPSVVRPQPHQLPATPVLNLRAVPVRQNPEICAPHSSRYANGPKIASEPDQAASNDDEDSRVDILIR